jgi:hypothetical protein
VALARTQLPSGVRAEDVTPEDFLRLSRVLVPGSQEAESSPRAAFGLAGLRGASPREGSPRGRRTKESG